MDEVAVMSYSEKYSRALDAYKHDEYMFAFVENHLGTAALAEFRALFAACVEPIPEDASPEEKYEIAFATWMRECRATYDFIRTRMGEEGLDLMAAVSIAALKREDPRFALLALNLVRAFSRRRAFRMVAKTLAYEFQWLTPYTVDELSDERAVFTIPRCKILDYPGSEDTCRIACRYEYPRWMADQYKVDMRQDRVGQACKVTLTPR